MALLMAGVSHRSAGLELREALALDGRMDQAFGLLKGSGLEEVVLLSTCNRVEAYAVAPDAQSAAARMRAFFEGLAPGRQAQVRKALYGAHDQDMLWHLLRVSASLDSMVLGEAQILGQVKEAYETAVRAGCVGPLFHGVFQRVFAAAKEVRNSTEIGRHPASVPSVAAQVAERLFGDLKGRAVLVLGGGEMAELTAEHLFSAGADRLIFCNRSYPKARALANRYKGRALGLERLDAALAEADVLVCSTGAPQALVRVDAARAAQQARHQQPQLFIDISVPRNIEPAVGALEHVYLYNLDDLDALAAEHRGRRETASREAEALLKRSLGAINDWMAVSRVAPTLGRLSAHFEAVREAELARASAKLAHLSPEDRQKVEALTKAMMNKLLHAPLSRLKAQAGGEGSAALVRGAEELFGLDPEKNQ
ncbi:MAG TPA: glutamyl-tRNA reductase [bacterium]|jgi:glutamyl-tRNA reductase|nr:glutamyl-tRNA reductase [bacterium]